jgi:hypothetical protein
VKSLPKTREEYHIWYSANLPEGIEWGQCWCGCGQEAPRARQTDRKNGLFKGVPRRFVQTHWAHTQRAKTPYVEEHHGYETPCWIWQLHLTKSGYGLLRREGKNRSAPRYYYEASKGPIPEGYEPDHLCRVRACVNPDHLEAVPSHENVRRGNSTVLTVKIVTELRRLKPTHTYAQLEAMTGYKASTVRAAVVGQNWFK